MSYLCSHAKSALVSACLVLQVVAHCWREPLDILPSLKLLVAHFLR